MWGHWNALTPCLHKQSQALTSSDANDSQACIFDLEGLEGVLPSFEVINTSRINRVEEGNRALQESSFSAHFRVIPVPADGECFLRALQMHMHCGSIDQDFRDFRILFVFMLERLMLDKDTRDTEHFAATQEPKTKKDRIRAILSQETYKGAWFSMTAFDMYCIDKLEGVMNDTAGLAERRWVDAEFDTISMLQALNTSLTLIIPAEDSSNKSKYCVLNGDGGKFKTRVGKIDTDFLMVHWCHETFQHFDPVYDTAAKKSHSVTHEVIARFKTAVTKSQMCQAYKARNWKRLRLLAVKTLKLPSSHIEEGTVHQTDLVWEFLLGACNTRKFGRLSIGSMLEHGNSDDPVECSLLRSWYSTLDSAMLTAAQRGDRKTFDEMCKQHSRTNYNSHDDYQKDVDDVWLSIKSVALPVLRNIALTLPVKRMKVYRGLRFLNRSKADEFLSSSLRFPVPTSFSSSIKIACKFALQSSQTEEICKSEKTFYSMLLVCEAEEVVQAPKPSRPEELEVWVRDSCTWRVKARCKDVNCMAHCNKMLNRHEWKECWRQVQIEGQDQIDIVLLEGLPDAPSCLSRTIAGYSDDSAGPAKRLASTNDKKELHKHSDSKSSAKTAAKSPACRQTCGESRPAVPASDNLSPKNGPDSKKHALSLKSVSSEIPQKKKQKVSERHFSLKSVSDSLEKESSALNASDERCSGWRLNAPSRQLRAEHVRLGLSRFLDLKRTGKMSGYNFIGWLDSSGELVKDSSPYSPHAPIYWEIPESNEWFCFSTQALHETGVKDAILPVDEWKRLVDRFSPSWRFLGFVHEQSQRCITHVPPPLFRKTKVRLHTDFGQFDVFACALKDTLTKECGALPVGCKMRLVPRPSKSFLEVCSQMSTGLLEYQHKNDVTTTFTWQVQSDAPSDVKNSLKAWNEGVSLNSEARRLIDRHASCADKNPHIWFCPPDPNEVKNNSWNSVLEFYHQNLSTTECWYDDNHRRRRRLSMGNVTHNTLPLMDYDRDAVNAWLSEFPIVLRLKSSSPTRGFHLSCEVELQDEVFRQTYSISIRDLKRLTCYHRRASEIAAGAADFETGYTLRNCFYIGKLLWNEKNNSTKMAILFRLFTKSSGRLNREGQEILAFKLADFMHLPDSQSHSTGNWLTEHTSGKIGVSCGSFTDCEKFYAIRRERRLTKSLSGELEWKLSDFQRIAKRNGIKYLGKPIKEGRLHNSIPELEEWITKYDVRLPALLIHEWNEDHVPDQNALQSLVWWKSDKAIPFQSRYGEVSDNLETMKKMQVWC